jgi:hypothetical protein
MQAHHRRFEHLVLRTNTRLNPLNVMLRYRELLVVAIRGHVFCSFLALVLRKDLEERLRAARLKPEWRELLADLDRLQEVEEEQDGKRFILRTLVTGVAGKVVQAAGIPLPPNIREADPLPSAA